MKKLLSPQTDFLDLSSRRPLVRNFFERKAQDVARELIGCYLVRKCGRKLIKCRITETEAYVGPHDLACHAARGRTLRTEPMFGRAGTLYVYLVYGMHWMLNVVTGPVNHPAAVLIRSVEGIVGPGRLTNALAINGDLNAKRANKETGVWFSEGPRPPRKKIGRSARIGVDYAGPVWSLKPYRWILKLE